MSAARSITLYLPRVSRRSGVASNLVATTRRYYRFNVRLRDMLSPASTVITCGDVRLKSLSIGVQMVGDNAMNTPPAHTLVLGIWDDFTVNGALRASGLETGRPPSLCAWQFRYQVRAG